jgi:hypothetical protein
MDIQIENSIEKILPGKHLTIEQSVLINLKNLQRKIKSIEKRPKNKNLYNPYL